MIAIFKRDFRAFFTSPIGYVLVGGFLIVMGMYFTIFNLMPAYSELSSMFNLISFILIFMAPILTMRLFSEEYKMKTDQLLLTSPVSVGGIVLGKFFAALCIFAVCLSGTLLYVVVVFVYGSPDVAGIVGNYIAILFSAGSFISIGLFISSLTENQIVSVFSSIGTFLAINILGAQAQSTTHTWLRDLINFFSMFTRYSDFSLGLFSLDNIVYYLSLTAVFLFLTARVLEKKRWS